MGMAAHVEMTNTSSRLSGEYSEQPGEAISTAPDRVKECHRNKTAFSQQGTIFFVGISLHTG